MSRASLLAVIVLSWTVIDAQSPPIAYLSLGSEDKLLLCARSVFGKPVFRSDDPPWPDDRIPCGSTPIALLAALDQSGFLVFDTGAFIYVVPRRFLGPQTPNDTSVSWKGVRLTLDVDSNPSRGTTPIAKEERDAIAGVILDEARTVPVSVRRKPDADGITRAAIRIDVDAPELKPGVRSIVAVEGGAGPGRLIYGEINGERYRPLWDSPLLEDHLDLRWGYEDLDGDGTKEILVYGSARPYYRTLTVFDVLGRQLLRDADCLVSPGDKSGACPILGEDIHIDDPVDGRRDIVAEDRFDKAPRRYRLADGAYRLVLPAKN